MAATYEVFAIRYAHLERTARHNFLGGDEDDRSMPLDYYVWAIVNPDRTVIVDTGFDDLAARRRGRQLVRPVADGLKAIGIAADKVEHIVISHMHYDHAGNQDLFPRARYHLQDAEMAYCTGRCMSDAGIGGVFDADAVSAMIHKVFAGRVHFHDGDAEIAPGITVHRVGGHTRGMQIVRVATGRGWVVLGSDSAHFYANLEPGRPFPILDDLKAYVEAQRTALRLASSPQHFIPGHDPLVLTLYPSARAGLDDVVRLDQEPRTGLGFLEVSRDEA
jgi:glyoxylase-like metal-dependent hydrolase (beta-lactamase superfamily II)